MNRGRQDIGLDLTTDAGCALALALVAGADTVLENQAAGVMARFDLDDPQLQQVRPDLVMVSMSAFGTGNAWSDTGTYGSTLEQGSGLTGPTGLPGTPPAMTHLAHGDPVGGLYGCAAALTALVHRQRSGQGQSVNLRAKPGGSGCGRQTNHREDAMPIKVAGHRRGGCSGRTPVVWPGPPPRCWARPAAHPPW